MTPSRRSLDGRRVPPGANPAVVHLRFLGTGASGGTPGNGRSRRLESSLLLTDDSSVVVIDLTRDFTRQAEALERIDAILLTHSHRDACGGIAQLRAWARQRSHARIDVLASPETIALLRRRYARLDHCRFIAVRAGDRRRIGRFTVSALIVPHARDPRNPTLAWKLRAGSATLVYASDVARLTGSLRRFCAGANALAIDAALWRRRLFSHLAIDEALPELCRWPIGCILLTHIGRSVPVHKRLQREAANLCPHAKPAYDGMALELAAMSR